MFFIDLRSLQEGFFNWRPKTPENYFNSKALPLNLANKSLYGANMLLGDGLMVRKTFSTSTSPLANNDLLDVDLPPLDHLPGELAHRRSSNSFDHCDCQYVFVTPQ